MLRGATRGYLRRCDPVLYDTRLSDALGAQREGNEVDHGDAGHITIPAVSSLRGMLGSVRRQQGSPILIGRDREWTWLSDAFEAAASGEPTVAIIGGEAGVGKTRLVREFTASATEKGALVLTGGCLQLGEEGLPFAPISAALRTLLRDHGPEVFAGQEREFARLIPELGPVEPEKALDSNRVWLYELVRALLERLATEQPLLLVVEDLHWSDRSTRDLLGYLIRTLQGVKALLVLTYRSDELHRGHPLRPFVAELDRLHHVRRMELGRLDYEATVAMVTSLLDQRPTSYVIDDIHRRSQGNPFFIEELTSCVTDGSVGCGLPDSLRDLLLIKVDKLPESAQRVLRIAAAGGTRITHRLLARVADIPEPELEEALRAAILAQLLVPSTDGESYEFRHALVREAVHADLLPGEQVRLHARYAAALEENPGLVDLDQAPAEIAYHWYAAHNHTSALVSAVSAARAARERYAYAEAQRLLERVLELWDQVPEAEERTRVSHLWVLEQTVEVATRAGDFDRALGLAKGALAEVDPTQCPLRAATLLIKQAKLLRFLGKADGLSQLRRAYRLLLEAGPSPEQATQLSEVAAMLLMDGPESEAVEVATTALEATSTFGDRLAASSAAVTMATVRAGLKPDNEGLAELAQALEIAGTVGDLEVLARAQTNYSDRLHQLGRYAEAAAVARAGLAAVQEGRIGRTISVLLVANFVESSLALGEWDECDEISAKTIRMDEPGTNRMFILVQRARLLLARGEDASDLVADAVVLMSKPYLPRHLIHELYEVLIRAALAKLDIARALETTQAALTTVDPTVNPRYAWPVVVAAARVVSQPALVADVAGNLAFAAAAAARQLPIHTMAQRAAALTVIAELQGTPAASSLDDVIERATPGEAWPENGLGTRIDQVTDAEARIAAWERAVAAWETDGQPYPLAQALVRLAEARAAVGDRMSIATLLERARKIARRLKARPLESEIEVLARRAGVRLNGGPVTANGSVTSGLTEREREVLRLLAAGHTNRQIAERLFISPKTASVHVSRILAKLAVSTRGEAAAVAYRLGLVSSR